MSLSIQKMVSDGTLSNIVLGVQYLQRNDMYMRIAGVETPQSGAPSGYTWSFLDNNTIRVLPVVPAGVEVVVYRRTDLDEMYNIYSQNAQFDESTIDENNQQLLYIAQEYFEQGVPAQLIESVEYVREDTTNMYYRLKLSDGKYTTEFPIPKGGAAGFDALRRTYLEAGLNLVDGSFETGGTLNSITDVLLHNVTAKAYAWSGAFPKVVAAGSTPTPLGSGGWIDRSDVTLRGELAGADGAKLVGACPDIATARTLTGLQTGQRVNVIGYYTTTPLVGGGTFIADAADTATADDGGMVLVTVDGVRLKRWLGFSGFAGVISAAWFGCVGDGATDNTARSQAALTYATNNGFSLSYPAGVFYHTGQVTKPQSFTAPNIYGAGANNQASKSTVLWFDSAVGLKIKGGSGALTRAAIYNCVLRGKSDQTTIPLQFADICGFDAIKCRFENAAFAAEFYNEASGGFTEFCRLVDCEITTSCLQAVRYRRGSGNDSFHGSGTSGNTVINEATGSALSQIVIGSGCLPYNSPLSFTVFKRSSTAIVQNDSGHAKANFFGNICYESSSSYSPSMAAGSVLTFVGGVNCLTQGLTRGTAILAERVTVNSDASVTRQLLKYNNVQTISSGNVLSGTDPDNNDAYLIHLTLSASNYEYSYLLAVYRNRGDSAGSVQTLATMRTFNTAGYGAPTFSYSGGVVVTNANYPAATVTARFTVTPIGARGNFPLM